MQFATIVLVLLVLLNTLLFVSGFFRAFRKDATMAEKVILHYFNGRGKMESIRWLLAVAGVEVKDYVLTG